MLSGGQPESCAMVPKISANVLMAFPFDTFRLVCLRQTLRQTMVVERIVRGTYYYKCHGNVLSPGLNNIHRSVFLNGWLSNPGMVVRNNVLELYIYIYYDILLLYICDDDDDDNITWHQRGHVVILKDY